MTINKRVRTRFAPSPTGPGMHIGGIRTALYNYLYAKKHGGDFILRIEDTDQERFVEGAEKQYTDTFKWLGIEFDESPYKGGNYAPYKQSERKDIYLPYAMQLIESGYAYYAFDTSDELNEAKDNNKYFSYNSETRMSMKNSLTLTKEEINELLTSRNDWTVRIKYPDTPTKIEFIDEVCGNISFMSNELDDKVIYKKKDNLPTYHLANVIDDHLMDITHVIRGNEWVNSTPLHCYLYDSLGWDRPKFAHLSLVLGPDGAKLSKRDGMKYGFSVFGIECTDPLSGEYSSGFKQDGYVPSAVINLLSFIGWNPGTEKELYTLDELIQDFDLTRVNKAGGKFNPVKAKWFNTQHIRKMDAVELIDDVRLDFNNRGIFLPESILLKLITDNKGKIDSTKGLYDIVSYLFEEPTEYDKKPLKKWRDNSANAILLLVDELSNIDDWNEEKIQLVFEQYVNFNGIKFGMFAPLIRVFLTGKGNGSSMFSIMEIIGKDNTIKRLSNYNYPPKPIINDDIVEID